MRKGFVMNDLVKTDGKRLFTNDLAIANGAGLDVRSVRRMIA